MPSPPKAPQLLPRDPLAFQSEKSAVSPVLPSLRLPFVCTPMYPPDEALVLLQAQSMAQYVERALFTTYRVWSTL